MQGLMQLGKMLSSLILHVLVFDSFLIKLFLEVIEIIFSVSRFTAEWKGK